MPKMFSSTTYRFCWNGFHISFNITVIMVSAELSMTKIFLLGSFPYQRHYSTSFLFQFNKIYSGQDTLFWSLAFEARSKPARPHFSPNLTTRWSSSCEDVVAIETNISCLHAIGYSAWVYLINHPWIFIKNQFAFQSILNLALHL